MTSNLLKTGAVAMPENKDDVEYWDPKCVDNFESYWKNELTEDEKRLLIEIRNQIFSVTTPEERIPALYREAVEILHCAWSRKQSKKCVLREANEDEAADGIGFYGVSETI
jgi:hypothetical protein